MFDKIAGSKFKYIVMYITVFAFVATSLVAIVIYKLSGNINGIAEVNGKEIPFYQFNYTYEMASRNLQQQNIDPNQFKKEIVKQVIDNLVETELIYQEAQKEGLEATSEQVKNELLNIPAFQVNGKFDKQMYIQLINSFGLSPEGFEDILKKELTVNNIKAILLASLYVSDEEVETFTNKQLTKISGEVTLIKPREPIISEREAMEYYQKYKNDYSSKKDKKVAVYKIEIKKYGQQKAQELAKDIFNRLKSGQEVASEDRIYEDALYNIKSQNMLPKQFLSMLEDISDKKSIVFYKDDEGYYIAAYKGEIFEEQPFENVKDSIVSKLKEQQVQKSIQQLHKSNLSLTELLKENEVIKENVDNKTMQEVIVKYGLNPDDAGKVLNLRIGQTSSPINVQQGILMVKLTALSLPDRQQVEEMKKTILPLIKNQKFNDIYQMYVDKLKEKANIKINKKVLENG